MASKILVIAASCDFLVLMGILCAGLSCSAEQAISPDQFRPGIRSAQRLTLISANDGGVHLKLKQEAFTENAPLAIERAALTRDSITAVTLGPDHPPIVKTFYGTVPSTISGAPYLATTPDGRFAFVTCHREGWLGPEAGDIVSMIDLSSPELKVIDTAKVIHPRLGAMHPDGKYYLVGHDSGFSVFDVSNGRLELKTQIEIGKLPTSFAISPKGDRLVAAQVTLPRETNTYSVHLYRFKDGVITHEREVTVDKRFGKFDKPFAMRFSPDGKRVLIPNGGGRASKGRLDDVLSLDMTLDPPQVTEVLPPLADGLESLAFHPKGNMAVIAGLDDVSSTAIAGFSHLIVVDLTAKPAKVLYHMPVDSFPEGIEFSPDGSLLFVQETAANRIGVFEVEGFMLKKSPFVLRVGHAPSAMGITSRAF